MITQIASDIIESAKSDSSFDEQNSEAIAMEYGVSSYRVMREIQYFRDAFNKITVENF